MAFVAVLAVMATIELNTMVNSLSKVEASVQLSRLALGHVTPYLPHQLIIRLHQLTHHPPILAFQKWGLVHAKVQTAVHGIVRVDNAIVLLAQNFVEGILIPTVVWMTKIAAARGTDFEARATPRGGVAIVLRKEGETNAGRMDAVSGWVEDAITRVNAPGAARGCSQYLILIVNPSMSFGV
mmetsp:Transcript_1173/g.1510  ORF Transcript_1173/g.1510 Transcript_1173/m.1510 type:complete len:182 (-) Transcript_1173:185-730(-)